MEDEVTYPQPYCRNCGTALILVPDANSWFCNNCNTYPELSQLTSRIGTPEGAQQFALRWILLTLLIIILIVYSSLLFLW